MRYLKKIERSCFNCDNFLYLGEGDAVCDLELVPGNELITPIIDGHEVTDHFFYCGGSKWKESLQ